MRARSKRTARAHSPHDDVLRRVDGNAAPAAAIAPGHGMYPPSDAKKPRIEFCGMSDAFPNKFHLFTKHAEVITNKDDLIAKLQEEMDLYRSPRVDRGIRIGGGARSCREI